MEFSLGSIFQSLDMDYSNGLIDKSEESLTTFQNYFFSQAKEKLKIDAVYFLRDSDGIPKIPMIYFAAMDAYDTERIAELHRLAWNSGEAPLLFVVLPDQLLVYNNYEIPARRDETGAFEYNTGLFERIAEVSDLETKRKKLQQFHRTQIETGEFWRVNKKRFNIGTRVDTTLMSNLKAIRKTLLVRVKVRAQSDLYPPLSDKECSEIVHSLLGRSILIKYLEERIDSNNNSVFPADFFGQFVPSAHQYADVLSDISATYALFKELEKKFNGDIFPVSENETIYIQQSDLIELQQFLLGTSDLATQQLALWPLYSFNVIPIQLISSIYELFFHLAETDPDKDNGTYYTPYHLVELLMDEVLPWEGTYSEQRILDPACGSGIFLVEAYRRLVARWVLSNKSKHVQVNDLITILQDCIYGVDCNLEAVRVASFSLSLALCDFLEPRTIWNDLHFPRLIHYNLFNNDFFDRGCDFERIDYDIVIGNPPWESKLSSSAKKYIKSKGITVGDKQIAQAFTFRAGDVCSRGVICLLLPSKSFLFNRSEPTRRFRASFFSRFEVSVIINFSAFRWVLFEHATGPAVGIIYRPVRDSNSDLVFYCTPKPLYTIEDRRHFLIEPNNICRIPRAIIDDDLIWKIAMWGSPRDMDLIKLIQSRGITIKNLFDDNKIVYAEGFKKGNKKKECDDFIGLPLLSAKAFQAWDNPADHLPLMTSCSLERTVGTKREVFKAPHLVVKQSHKGSRFLADVLDYDAVFNHSLLGAHGNEQILKYCCVIIGSKVFTYYQMMTNRKWLVERDELEAGDILDMPIPVPTESALSKAEQIFNLMRSGQDVEIVDQFACQQYDLFPHDIELIDDAIKYLYDYYHKKSKTTVFDKPSVEMLQAYFETLHNILINTLGNVLSLSCHFYQSEAPLIVAEFLFSPSIKASFSSSSTEVNALLQRLDNQLLEERSGSVYIKRNVRVYGKDSICIIKPNQLRYWNYSSACRDADEVCADVMRVWREQSE